MAGVGERPRDPFPFYLICDVVVAVVEKKMERNIAEEESIVKKTVYRVLLGFSLVVKSSTAFDLILKGFYWV